MFLSCHSPQTPVISLLLGRSKAGPFCPGGAWNCPGDKGKNVLGDRSHSYWQLSGLCLSCYHFDHLALAEVPQFRLIHLKRFTLSLTGEDFRLLTRGRTLHMSLLSHALNPWAINRPNTKGRMPESTTCSLKVCGDFRSSGFALPTSFYR